MAKNHSYNSVSGPFIGKLFDPGTGGQELES